MSMQSTTSSRGQASLFVRALREAFFAGLISFGMFVLYVGLKTDQNIRNELVLTQRWGLLAVFVGVRPFSNDRLQLGNGHAVGEGCDFHSPYSAPNAMTAAMNARHWS